MQNIKNCSSLYHNLSTSAPSLGASLPLCTLSTISRGRVFDQRQSADHKDGRQVASKAGKARSRQDAGMRGLMVVGLRAGCVTGSIRSDHEGRIWYNE